MTCTFDSVEFINPFTTRVLLRYYHTVAVALFLGSPSASVHNMTFDPVEGQIVYAHEGGRAWEQGYWSCT